MRRTTAAEMIRRLRAIADPADARVLQGFFKTGPGEYGEGDVFLGVRVPQIRGLVREHRGRVTVRTADRLLASRYHEARLLGLLLLVDLFRRSDEAARRSVYGLYLARTDRINNWDLVDLSAGHIVGGWLAERSRKRLYRLARSPSLWERRIAVLATSHFIARGEFDDILCLAEMLLGDAHDLMHKAVGWMLRETGKRDAEVLRGFLARHATRMPRTMLRYAVEKFPPAERSRWMATKRHKKHKENRNS
jgi:3-methyladenine DNA glycosylase AlkD